MKPFTVGMALEAGRVTPQTPIQTAPGRRDRRLHHQRHAQHGMLTVQQVIQKSSNIGALKIALQMQPREMWETYTALGFGQKPQISFPGAVSGPAAPVQDLEAGGAGDHVVRLRPVGVAVPDGAFLHRVRARRQIIPVTMLKNNEPPVGVRVFSAKTRMAVRKMLQMAPAPAAPAPGADAGLLGRRQVRHGAQAGRQGLREQQVPLVVRRHGADRQAAHHRRGDGRRAERRPSTSAATSPHPCSARWCSRRCA
jgi:cell division protein FtsI (penicillin-binding protein 3)